MTDFNAPINQCLTLYKVDCSNSGRQCSVVMIGVFSVTADFHIYTIFWWSVKQLTWVSHFLSLTSTKAPWIEFFGKDNIDMSRVILPGLEPAIYWLQVKCSKRLNMYPFCLFVTARRPFLYFYMLLISCFIRSKMIKLAILETCVPFFSQQRTSNN